MEATGYARWFERLLAELGFELWIGDPAETKPRRVRKQKTDRNDARLLLRLLLENRFPQIWAPSPENADAGTDHESTAGSGDERGQALENKAVEPKKGRSELAKLPLAFWASRRRQELLELLDHMNPIIGELTAADEQEAEKRPEALRLMTHSWCGSAHGPGLCVDHRDFDSVSLWQANRQLHRLPHESDGV